MNQEQDKEFDVLLRRYAKREGQRTKAAMFFDEGNGKKMVGFTELEHLDADAMNAYAENALPSAARMRYAEHLVGCDACRKVVTQLALTANPTGFVKEESTSVSTINAQTWREKLLSFLTIPSLKLAGSVAAVLLVASVTFIVWKRNDVSTDLAQNKQPRNVDNGAAAYDANNNASPNSGNTTATSPAASPDTQNRNNPQPTTVANEPVAERRKDTSATKSGESKKERDYQEAGSPSTGEDAPKDAKNDNSKTAAASQPTPTNVQTNSDPSAQNQTNIQDQTVAQQRQNYPAKSRTGPNNNRAGRDSGEGNRAQKAEEKKTDSGDDERAEKQKKSAPPPAPKKSVDSDKTTLAGGNKREAETRAVGGKKFQRIGDAWVDVAYKDSATTNIKRGSDQYNSLDAGLRSIAEQLGGEVIVVWQGRAYKIR